MRVDDVEAELARGLADGTLATDTRLRDALRALREGSGGFGPPESAPTLEFPRPGADDDAEYAGEAALLVEIDAVVRAEERIDAFEQRLQAIERGTLRRLARR